jgi:hypothetical protein
MTISKSSLALGQITSSQTASHRDMFTLAMIVLLEHDPGPFRSLRNDKRRREENHGDGDIH